MTTADSIQKSDLQTLIGDTFLQSVEYFSSTDSTNNRAVEALAGGDVQAAPCLVYAEHQSTGRGRGENQWWSAEGSLTFSLIVDLNEIGLSAHQRPLLPLLTGMAVLQTGESAIPTGEFALKWPNDVYLANRKLAGVLIEVPSQSAGQAVIGVGVNVNNHFSGAPHSLQATCIALADRSETQHDRIQILRTFLRRWKSLVKSLAAGNSFLNDWPCYCLLTGKHVTLNTGSQQFAGICQGVDAAGALLLEIDGHLERFFGGIIVSWN